VRVMIEGLDEARLKTWADEIASALAEHCKV
jgi:hypothetical protein